MILGEDQIARLPEIEESPLAGPEFPRQALVPDKEWLYPGHREPLEENGKLRVMARVLVTVSWGDRDRPVFVMVTGWGAFTDCLHTYPKSHWTKDEAEQFHRLRMANPAWQPPKSPLIEVPKAVPNFASLLEQAPNELRKDSVQWPAD